jgi:hypothetical protein
MTKVKVTSGACGFEVLITAQKGKDGRIALQLDTRCDMVRAMLADIAELDRFAPLTGLQNNVVYKSAAKRLKHVACAVPSGILKAIEVEAGLNVAKDATIVFLKEDT